MANTDRYSGKDTYVSFAGQDMSADFTSVSRSDTGNQISVMAGSDSYDYLLGLSEAGNVAYEGYYNGTSTPWSSIAINEAGTLIIGPRGTTAGYVKWTWTRALVGNRGFSSPFNDGQKVTATFNCSSTCTEGTW